MLLINRPIVISYLSWTLGCHILKPLNGAMLFFLFIFFSRFMLQSSKVENESTIMTVFRYICMTNYLPLVIPWTYGQ